jgi:hypothetical protein
MNSKEHPCPDCRYPKRIDEDYCPTCPFSKIENESKSSRWSSLFDFGSGSKAQQSTTSTPQENPFPQIPSQPNIEPIRQEAPQTSYEFPTPHNYPPSPPSEGRHTMLPGTEMPPLPRNVPRGTFNPYTQPLVEIPKFKLTSVPRHTETSGQTNEYEGDSVALKRANLDKENFTISSQEHATIENVNNKWYISNKSSLKTTYVQVNAMTEITDGDVILIGDRMFIFRPQ